MQADEQQSQAELSRREHFGNPVAGRHRIDIWYARLERWSRVAIAVHVVAMLSLVVLFDRLPMQDYPDWLYQGYIFNQYVFHGNDFGGAFSLYHYLPPNGISTVIIGLLAEIVAPLHAGRIFIGLMMLAVYFGIYLYAGITVRNHRMLCAAIAFTFVFSYNFWLGNINFVMGLGVALLGAYLLIGRRWIERVPPTMAVILLCYSCHFFSLVMLGLALLAFIVAERRADLLPKLMLAALPAAALFVHYVMNANVATGDEHITLTLFQQVRERAAMFAGVIIPFQRFFHISEPTILHRIANYTYLVGVAALTLLAAYTLFRRRQWMLNSVLVPVVLPLIFLLPLYTSGIVYPGERLVVFFMVNLLVVIIAFRPRLTRVLLPAYLLMNIAVWGYALDNISLFAYTIGGGQGRLDARTVPQPGGAGGTDPYTRVEYYDHMPTPGGEGAPRISTPLPIFRSGLFDYVPDSLRHR